jgi:SpoVK/Ycf46/Vps4 family AAA+-type ATPase
MIDFGFGAPTADPFERWLLRRYASGILAVETRLNTRPSRAFLARWLVDNAEDLGAPEPTVRPDAFDEYNRRVSNETWQELTPLYDRLLASDDEAAPRPSRLERRLAWLADMLRLHAFDRAILGALVRVALSRPVRELLDRLEGQDGPVGYNDETKSHLLRALLGRSITMVIRRLRASAPLRCFGLVEDRGSGDFAPSATMLTLARHGGDTPTSLRRLLIGKSTPSELAWSDFAHLGYGRELAERVLRDALRRRRRGVNILLYGPPGTGKTEFARALAQRIGVSAAFAGETGAEGAELEPTRESRIASVALTGALAARVRRTLVVVDEADDIFLGVDGECAPARRGSKVFMHRLVDAVEAPTVWITNYPRHLGEAVVRRMTLVVRFAQPTNALRRRIVERCAARQGLPLDDAERAGLADLNVPPAVLSTAIRTAQRIAGDATTVQQLLRGSARLLSGACAPAAPAPVRFDPALSGADTDLAALASRIATVVDPTALSFCFHGVPGSGKSVYARHLAERLELDVVEKRASDLLSKWLGETEKAIREAFEEAADQKAFLIFDEADSLLADRRAAHYSWEVTQVNEMLTWMERHAGPVACTTNAFEALDPAALRRFIFKVKFFAMTPAQIAEAFRRHFDVQAPATLLRLDGLTPGDFAVVARKARVLGEIDAARIARWLADEVAAKSGSRPSSIGF